MESRLLQGRAPTVSATLADILAGKWSDYPGTIKTLGLVSENPEDNYVQIPMESTQWADGFTVDDYKALVAKMYSGEIKVSNDISAMPETTAANVEIFDSIK